jgi:hypothetical protein
VTGVDRLAFLADGAGGVPGAFARAAAIPAMPWIERPDRGWLAGTLGSATQPDTDTVVVKVRRKKLWPFGGTARVQTDGNGYFGLANVKPGRYDVSVDRHGRRPATVEVRVEAGKVARVTLDSRHDAPPQSGPQPRRN